jgi:hypothetical protein
MTPTRPGNEDNNKLARLAISQWGGDCLTPAKQIICVNSHTRNGRPMTVGDYLLYPKSWDGLTKDLENEAKQRAMLRSG